MWFIIPFILGLACCFIEMMPGAGAGLLLCLTSILGFLVYWQKNEPAEPPYFEAVVRIRNSKAVESMWNVVYYLEEQAAGKEWDTDLTHVAECAKYLAKNLTVPGVTCQVTNGK